jgi:hypothetical protein
VTHTLTSEQSTLHDRFVSELCPHGYGGDDTCPACGYLGANSARPLPPDPTFDRPRTDAEHAWFAWLTGDGDDPEPPRPNPPGAALARAQ